MEPLLPIGEPSRSPKGSRTSFITLLLLVALVWLIPTTTPRWMAQHYTRAISTLRPLLVPTSPPKSHQPLRATRPSTPNPPSAQMKSMAALFPLDFKKPPMSPATSKALRGAMAFASALAMLVSTVPPEALAVDGPYLQATADSIHATIQEVGGVLQQHSSRKAPPVAVVDTVNSLMQVLQGSAQEFGRLAAADSIGDIPKQGWFDNFVALIESSILGLDKVLKGLQVPGSLGMAITLFTMGVKALLLPVNFAQLKSTVQMQTMQPLTKEIQEKYKDTPDKMNLMLAELYRKNNVNPLVAILPAFAQIPIFIGLYRALLNLGQLNLLDEPFLWLPSLEGPTFDLQAGHTLDWLTQGMLSTSDTLAYLTIPVILIVTQLASTELSKTPNQETPKWVYYLPLLTASFSLNVPSGLAVYWIVNTVVTTASNLAIKEYLKNDPAILAAAETDIDSLDIEQYQNAPAMPSYQEALLQAVEKDPELQAAFAEMRQSPSAVMKYYGDRAFTTKLAEAVQAQQQLMIQEQEAKAAEAKAVPKAAFKPKENLCMAVKTGNVTAVKTYLAQGVSANFKDENGISALHYAVGKGRVDYLTLLVDAGGDLGITDNNQNTLLHYAAGYGRDDIIKYLADRKADFNALNTMNQTPLDLAKAEDNKFATKKTLELLTSNGAKEGIGFGPVAPEVLDNAQAPDNK